MIRYHEGLELGKRAGEVSGALILLNFLKNRKVLDKDHVGNIFRINDNGMRGENIVTPEDIAKAVKASSTETKDLLT